MKKYLGGNKTKLKDYPKDQVILNNLMPKTGKLGKEMKKRLAPLYKALMDAGGRYNKDWSNVYAHRLHW